MVIFLYFCNKGIGKIDKKSYRVFKEINDSKLQKLKNNLINEGKNVRTY